MGTTQRRSPLRLLAPAALVLFGVLFVAVIVGSLASDDGGPARPAQNETRQAGGRTTPPGQAPGGAAQAGAEGETAGQAGQAGQAGETPADRREAQLPADVYVVKTGDTLSVIADKTGLSVEKLQELNPDLDPQTLVSGQQIKLR